MTEKMVTVAEAAQIIGVSVPSIHQYTKAGKLTATKEGRKNMYLLEEVEAVRDERAQKKSGGGTRQAKTEAPAAADPEGKPPVPVAPPADPISEIPVRSVIELSNNAVVWRMNMETQQWEQAEAQGVTVTVTERRDNAGQMFLMCRAPDSQSLWSIAEADVLSGKLNLVSRPVATPQVPPVAPSAPVASDDPGMVVGQAEATEDDAAKQAEKELLERKILYSKALLAYAAANDEKLASAGKFKKVDKDCRSTIWDYLEEFGEESEAGKNDRVVEDFGYRAILTFTEGKTVVRHDVAKIVSWALENNQTGILTYSIDVDRWNALKETGEVPADFIASVEKPEKLKDSRKLVINKLKGSDKE